MNARPFPEAGAAPGSPEPAGRAGRPPSPPMLRDLELDDIPQLAAFAPAEWHVALDHVLLQHVGRSYFRARVAADADGIAAVGHCIMTGRTGWLGNIIVRPDARRRGLGSAMTRDLVAMLRLRGCSRALLVATPMGERVYAAQGFRAVSHYVFLDVPRLPPFTPDRIRCLKAGERADVLRLDAAATGEARSEMLAPHLASGWVHLGHDDCVDGFFLPSLGAGLVVASGAGAGLDLLRFKHAFYPAAAVVPEANRAARQFLIDQGARETAKAPRMAAGGDVEWRPDWIFARAAGYCG